MIRPNVLDYGSADFSRRNQAILEGEKAALAALPQIRTALAQLQAQRLAQARERQAQQVQGNAAVQDKAVSAPRSACADTGSRWNRLRKKDPGCVSSD